MGHAALSHISRTMSSMSSLREQELQGPKITASRKATLSLSSTVLQSSARHHQHAQQAHRYHRKRIKGSKKATGHPGSNSHATISLMSQKTNQWEDKFIAWTLWSHPISVPKLSLRALRWAIRERKSRRERPGPAAGSRRREKEKRWCDVRSKSRSPSSSSRSRS